MFAILVSIIARGRLPANLNSFSAFWASARLYILSFDCLNTQTKLASKRTSIQACGKTISLQEADTNDSS
jgi:hypothetical protein